MMRVIVVGAGIGGLSAAIALRRAGHDVVVLERAASPRIEGAGLGLPPNAISALDALGLAAPVTRAGTPARLGAILASDGTELIRIPPGSLSGTIAIARADLLAVLARAADGIQIRFGAEVVALEQPRNDVVATVLDGSRERADLLIGADGINSVVRRAVDDKPLRYAGYIAWRGIAPLGLEPGRFTESWGRGERFGLIDIGWGRTYWFATKNARPGEPDEPDGRHAEIVSRFSDWHPPVAAVLAATEPAAILRNDVYFLPALARWSRGRIVLVGDAAHATTPGIGQGAAQAVEDAIALAGQLQRQPTVERALAAYEALRRPRTRLVHTLSRRTDKAAQLANPVAGRLRNAIVRQVRVRMQLAQLDRVARQAPGSIR
jgi:2-polyprenyl-6-methoxyphenol hydroxylase-like FAD-dependent oxidoreductase